ncbi:MAG: hypothetical protein CSA68_02290 [Rhodobacterales bacterium]|nr:MAG: hypothetical protein CSA68_02290 [Rhodobacterales bacterium]
MTDFSKNSWEGILEEGEELLWQGRPRTDIVFQKRHILPAILAVGVAGLGIIWIFFTGLGNGYTVVMGVFLLIIAALLGFGPPVMTSMIRKATWYSLSNKRGFIATHRPQLGRKLAAYRIDPDYPLRYDHKSPGTIIFATEIRQPGNAAYTVKIGFERIDDSEKVYQMLRAIQQAHGGK